MVQDFTAPQDGDFFAIDIIDDTNDTMLQLYEASAGVGFDVFGNARKSLGGSSWGILSDERLKQGVTHYTHGLEQIAALRTVRFCYKGNNELGITSSEENIGFIVQDVQKVIPEAVSEDHKGYLNLNVDPIHWAAINAIQELNDIVTSQSQTIATQAEENAALKKQLAEMQTQLGTITKAISALQNAKNKTAAE